MSSAEFVRMARSWSGCEVWRQDFVQLDLPPAEFDGIFANASLFHVPSAALPDVLRRLYAALKPDGVLFSSNPRGDNREGWNGPRYGSYYDYETWERYLTAAGFEALGHYYRPPGLLFNVRLVCGSEQKHKRPGATMLSSTPHLRVSLTNQGEHHEQGP
eukprot:gene6989-8375_t